MKSLMTPDQYQAYQQFVKDWSRCNFLGTICSVANRTNDVPQYLAKLGVASLLQYLWIDEKMQAFVYQVNFGNFWEKNPNLRIDEKTQAFVYRANFGVKNPIRIVEIYYDLRPRATDWRVRHAQVALYLDRDLEDGLEEGVVVTDFAVPFAKTALEEVKLIY